MTVLTIFLALVSSSLERQADALISYATKPDSKLYGSLEGFDNSGNLWMAYEWKDNLYLSVISPSGEWIIKSKLLLDFDGADLGLSASKFVFDRWNNAYFSFVVLKHGSESIDLRVVRVSSKGDITDYSPWPELAYRFPAYMTILPNDTLMVLGYSLLGDLGEYLWHLSKVLIGENGEFIPVVDLIKPHGKLPHNLGYDKLPYTTILTNWSKGWAIYAAMTLDIESSNYDPDLLRIKDIDISFHDDVDSCTLYRNEYKWRDYIWKTFKAYTPELFFAPYKDEGYVLYIPDARNRELTHSIRFDKNGELIEPSELKGRGRFRPRSFTKIPSDSKKYCDFQWWRDSYLNLDSVRVVFWGSDNKGNLYVYQKKQQF